MTGAPHLWFVVPAHGRCAISRVCYQALAWACEQLGAQAVVMADDQNLQLAAAAGLHTLRCANLPLGKKWNDGYEHACRQGASHCVSFGSDDWVDPGLVEAMVAAVGHSDQAIACTAYSACVREDGGELCELEIPYEGGDGVRVLARPLLDRLGWRPTVDGRNKAIDGGMRDRLLALGHHTFVSLPTDPLQVVDFKSAENLTGYDRLVEAYGRRRHADPAAALAAWYPAELIEAMQGAYA